MCFSVTASFTVAGALVPVGVYTLSRLDRLGWRWAPLAAYPLAFSLQQAIEGLVWMGLDRGDQALVAGAARGFLFFSHFFWPAWVPFSIWWLERGRPNERWLRLLSVIGVLFGLSIALPSILIADWLAVEVIHGSIEYKTRMIYDGFVDRGVLRVVYGAVVVLALFLPTIRTVRIFGALVVASLLFSVAFFDHAFVSVWCFFAAVLSAYVAVIVAVESRRNAPSDVTSR